MKQIFIALTALTVVLTSCKKEEITPTPTNPTPTPSGSTQVELGSATTSNNETIKLYADDSLTTGYNYIYVSAETSTGDVISNASIELLPIMDMGTMMHSCPVENPIYNSTTEMYDGASIFQMASGSGSWEVKVIVNSDTVSFPVNVALSAEKPVGTYAGLDGEMYVVSLHRPVNWVVGMNPLKVLIHKRATMMSFPADDGLTVVLDPEMVSMGHGSPNNIDPISTGNGYYEGQVNLTMSGDWRFHLELSRAGVVVHNDAFLDILF